MAKKWHSRGTHALSSGLAVVTLVGAGVAAASQGGVMGALARRSAGSEAATGVDGRRRGRSCWTRHGGRRLRRIGSVSPDGSGSSTGPDAADGSAVRDGSIPLIPGSCDDAMSSVRASMPESGDTPGIEQAIAVVSANCADAPQSQGLLTALDHLLSNQGSGGGTGAGNGNGGTGSPGAAADTAAAATPAQAAAATPAQAAAATPAQAAAATPAQAAAATPAQAAAVTPAQAAAVTPAQAAAALTPGGSTK